MQVPWWLLLILGTAVDTVDRDLDGVDGFCGDGAIQVGFHAFVEVYKWCVCAVA